MGDAGLAHARRAGKAEDLPLGVRVEHAHRQQFQNAVLDLFQTIVLPVQVFFRPGKVQIVGGVNAPRQRKAGVQIGADDRRLLAVALHLAQALRLFFQLFGGFLRQAEGMDLVKIPLGLIADVVVPVQFGGDGPHLLPQIVVPLVLLHLVVDLVLNFLFKGQDLVLAIEQVQGGLKAAHQGVLLQNSLFVLVFEQKVRRDVLAQKGRVAAGKDGVHHILGHAGIELKIGLKGDFQAAHQRFGVDAARLLKAPHRGLLYGDVEHLLAAFQRQQTGTVLPFHQHLHQIVGDTHHLLDLCHHAVAVQVGSGGLLHVHLALGDEENGAGVGHRPLNGGNALLPADLEMNDASREHHKPAQGNGRQMQHIVFHFDFYSFRHWHSLPKTVRANCSYRFDFGIFFCKVCCVYTTGTVFL